MRSEKLTDSSTNALLVLDAHLSFERDVAL